MATTMLFRRAAARLSSSGLVLFSKTAKPVSPARTSMCRSHFSCISRLPVELSCSGSMMPLHNAIASALLRSRLASESQSWGLVPQGLSLPL
ncbi:uncharacterized protein LOC116256401 [Nymphaea colorata]|nr:uncharacterized protein LOC116256401 [Nymphaea colorata]